jgi:tetratricopeptide (TPR) repeat protein
MSAVPHHVLLASLRRLRQTLPADMPLSGLRIAAVGDRLAVLEPGAAWDPHSGQLLLDLERVDRPEGTMLHLRRTDAPRTAADWYRRASEIEDRDPAAAEAAYRHAIALQPDLAAAYVDLGAMLCDAGRCGEAVQLYASALRHAPGDPLVHFNAAIAQEDLGQPEAALGSYEAALGLDPAMADAHYNAARLCEQLGQRQRAVRHYSAYRRLERPPPVEDGPP